MFFILILFLVLLGACSEEQPAEEEREVFDGPIRKGTDITMTYAEETIKMVVLKAKTLLEFKAGDREFPDGIFIEFYDENEILSTTLEGNKGYYYRAENLWKVTGDVKVISFEKNQQLNSEELFWDPDRKKIYTEKFGLKYSLGAPRISEKLHEMMISAEEAPRTFFDRDKNVYFMHYSNLADNPIENEYVSSNTLVSKQELESVLEKYNYFKP